MVKYVPLVAEIEKQPLILLQSLIDDQPYQQPEPIRLRDEWSDRLAPEGRRHDIASYYYLLLTRITKGPILRG